MRRLSIAALLTLLVAAAAEAAPAPFPRPEGKDAEAVFDAKTPERARLALLYLRSSHFIGPLADALTDRDRLRGIGTHPQLVAWLRQRLSVETNGGHVRVRFRGESDALAFVTAVARVLSRDKSTPPDAIEKVDRILKGVMRDDYAARVAQMRQLGTFSRADLLEAEENLARYEIAADPLAVHSSPQRVRRGR
jgi:hypothetical protein